jgi:cysteine desulfurase
MAVAFDLACEERDRTATRLRSLRGRLARAVVGAGGTELTGHPAARLPGLLSVVAPGLDGAALVMALDLAGVAASVGSACTTGSLEPSHVLTAMGYPADEARGALRLSLGRTTTAEQVDAAAAIITTVLAEQRSAAQALAADPLGMGAVG